MKTPPLSVILLGPALLLAGCAATLSLERSFAPGTTATSYEASERPVIYAGSADRYFGALKIRVRGSGETVWRLPLAHFYPSDPEIPLSSSGRVNDPAASEHRGPIFAESGEWRVRTPWLPAGDYVAELWIRGRVVRSAGFTVRAAGTEPAPGPAALVAALTPQPPPVFATTARDGRTVALPAAIARREIAALDSLVGLSSAQRQAVADLLAATYRESGPLPASARGPFDQSLRALLAPEQRRLLDDDGTAYRTRLEAALTAGQKEDLARELAVLRRLPPLPPEVLARRIGHHVQRLDRLVKLTADQKSSAAAIFGAEENALAALPTPEERTIQGTAIHQKARAEIRALLTPRQLAIYNSTPPRLGGGMEKM